MPKTETSSNALDDIDLEKVSGGTDVQIGQISTDTTNSDSSAPFSNLKQLVSSIISILKQPPIPH